MEKGSRLNKYVGLAGSIMTRRIPERKTGPLRLPSLVACAMASLSLFLMGTSTLQANERTPRDSRKLPVKQPDQGSRLINTFERPISVGFGVSKGRVVVTVKASDGTYEDRYEAVQDANRDLNVRELKSIRGTPEGIAAIMRLLAEIMEGNQVDVRRVALPSGPFHGRADAVAVFEEGENTRLLIARLRGDSEFVFDDVVVVAAGCSASPPGGSCSCTGEGAGAKCRSGVNPQTGESWAKCKDGPNEPSPEQTDCTYSGQDCSCSVTAAQ